MWQCQIEIGYNFPVSLVLLSNGTLAFVRVANGVVCESATDGDVVGVFYEEGFDLGKAGDVPEGFDYNVAYNYKEIPVMLKWLQQQNLIQPE